MPLAPPSLRSFRLTFRRVAGVMACLMASGFSTALEAADRTVTNLVQKEIARRNSLIQEARALMTEGALLQEKGEFAQAASTYRAAWDLLPDSPMTAQLKIEARDGYSRAAVAYAGKLASTGRYGEARGILKSVLAPDFDPANQEAKDLEIKLDDPDRYEPALTPRHVDNVAKVEKGLRLGQGFISLGDYNSAISRFHEVLRIDPYNHAARRGMERAEQLKSQYFDAARDHSRAKRLAEVDAGWEDISPSVDLSALFADPSKIGVMGGAKENILLKLRTILLPVVDLQGASLAEVVEFLRIRTREMDPEKRGVDFVLKVSPEIASMPVTLSMVNVPVEEVLRYATELSGTVYRADEFAVTITSRVEKSGTLISRSYRVPPDFLQNAPMDATAPGAPAPNPFAPPPAPGLGGGLQFRRLGAREFLEQRGVVFPEGATAAYTSSTNILYVRNTAENLVLIDALVEEAASASPKLIEIQVKLVEVNQTRLAELGFDWLMGQFNVPGSHRVFASGGNAGNGLNNLAADVPFGLGGTPVGLNPVTSGLRSSGAILGTPSIDGLIGRVSTPTIDSRSPAAFAVAGVLTDPQFQFVMRALSQSKGVDLMTSPTVVTKAGQRATINIVREFIYPTEYDPPQIPQNINPPTLVSLVNGSTSTGGYTLPVTPSTPTTFEKRDVGISLEAEAIIGADGRTVDLNLVPSSTEFEGFIDYGQDFSSYTVAQFADLVTATTWNTVTYFPVDNPILQPIFRTNKVTTSVSIWDGSTIVLGGVMYEKRQDIKDKVPILGDIPIIGRSFQSKVSHQERKNVIFFVTVRVVDPGGNRVNQPVLDPAAAAAP